METQQIWKFQKRLLIRISTVHFEVKSYIGYIKHSLSRLRFWSRMEFIWWKKWFKATILGEDEIAYFPLFKLSADYLKVKININFSLFSFVWTNDCLRKQESDQSINLWSLRRWRENRLSQLYWVLSKYQHDTHSAILRKDQGERKINITKQLFDWSW